MKAVKITPVESLMLRGPGEFDPSARGVTVAAQSAAWPSPGTIAGMLLALATQGGSQQARSWPELLEKYKKLMAGLEWIRGPYYVDERGAVYVPALVKKLYLVNWRQLGHYFQRYKDYFMSSDVERVAKIEEFIDRLSPHSIRPPSGERVGISLTSREGRKAVREGYLYVANFIDFRNVVHTSSPTRGSFVVEIGGEIKLASRVAAFGGESRIARLDVDGKTWLVDQLSTFRGGYVVLLSPTPLPHLDVKEVERRLLFGRVGTRGLGYAVAEKTRKPIYPTILEGSILHVENCGDVKKYGIYACFPGMTQEIETLGMLGFGSFAVL